MTKPSDSLLLRERLANRVHELGYYHLPDWHYKRLKHWVPRRAPDNLSRPSDLLILSFPQSGRTWLRLRLGFALAHHHRLRISVPFLVHEILNNRLHYHSVRIPRLTFGHDIGSLVHHAFDPDEEQPPSIADALRGKTVLLLLRDPRDVVVSRFFHLNKRKRPPDPKHYPGSLEAFLREPASAVAAMVRYYNVVFRDLPTAGVSRIVHYEDMHRHPERELRAVLHLAGVDAASDETLRDAFERASFDAMRGYEERRYSRTRSLTPSEQGNYETYKTRRGAVGRHSQEMSPAELELLESLLRTGLDPAFPHYREAAPAQG